MIFEILYIMVIWGLILVVVFSFFGLLYTNLINGLNSIIIISFIIELMILTPVYDFYIYKNPQYPKVEILLKNSSLTKTQLDSQLNLFKNNEHNKDIKFYYWIKQGNKLYLDNVNLNKCVMILTNDNKTYIQKFRTGYYWTGCTYYKIFINKKYFN